jgi:hypothetical protein
MHGVGYGGGKDKGYDKMNDYHSNTNNTAPQNMAKVLPNTRQQQRKIQPLQYDDDKACG